MKENDTFNEDKNFLFPELLPIFSICPSKKCKKKKISNIKKTDKAECEELESYNPNNNVNINQISIHDLGPDLDSINKYISFNKNNNLKEAKKNDKKYLGRKKKDSSETGKHNKYSGDNLIRKCKGIILNSLHNLINKIIEEVYQDDEDYDKKNQKLLKINQEQIINSDVNFNKNFIHKKLKDIFSENVTLRCKTYNVEHNKNLINGLLVEKDEKKRKLFDKIFNLSFLDCLKHFRGSKYIKELKDLMKYDKVCKNFEEDEDYLDSFKFYIENYEQIIENKRPRKKKKEVSNEYNNIFGK